MRGRHALSRRDRVGRQPAIVRGQPETTATVATYVANPASLPIFTFDDENGATLADPVDVWRSGSVHVELQVDLNPTRAPNVFTLSGGATLRNLFSVMIPPTRSTPTPSAARLPHAARTHLRHHLRDGARRAIRVRAHRESRHDREREPLRGVLGRRSRARILPLAPRTLPDATCRTAPAVPDRTPFHTRPGRRHGRHRVANHHANTACGETTSIDLTSAGTAADDRFSAADDSLRATRNPRSPRIPIS